MVDFQSRDSRLAGDDEADADEGNADAAGGADEHAHAEGRDDSGRDESSHGESGADTDGESHGHAADEHDHHAHDVETVGFGVVTVSSSRSEDDDPSGDAIVSLLDEGGHEVVSRDVVPDDYDRVQGVVDRIVRQDEVDAIVTTGGTGVTPDDVTVEAVRPLCDKRLPGFGELFRRLSYEEIGTRVVGTRAEAGVASGVPVFCLPGSESAVRLGVSEVILPEVAHLVGLATRPEHERADGPTDADAATGEDGAGDETGDEEGASDDGSEGEDAP
ncbi:MogA/MoaB family molybdenum cofactor biosynthesis protein [Halarchaeum sp. CBA1220]|uniref:MogA/MoaB family molybdenum cofactor biosynthesis protein n=1 Tax=Halarchaeum sp. CBA1220 TaxID=1853682 RepID=UPI000F3A9DBB|nr:MogA/MoaB family molybdenum cofactor biosynthesis protein [Halarchaeum sp. CBA1220]QLC32971.1 MogA/MoaB family molybdenum cofactor biosynthesis protein [Halarchaeum sp. CBA1220]